MRSILARGTEPLRLLLTAREAAEALGVSERFFGDLLRSGAIPHIRLPGRGAARAIRIAVADLENWIARTKAEQKQAGGAA